MLITKQLEEVIIKRTVCPTCCSGKGVRCCSDFGNFKSPHKGRVKKFQKSFHVQFVVSKA